MLNQGNFQAQKLGEWDCSSFETLRDLSLDRRELGRILSVSLGSLVRKDRGPRLNTCGSL